MNLLKYEKMQVGRNGTLIFCQEWNARRDRYTKVHYWFKTNIQTWTLKWTILKARGDRYISLY